MAITLQESLRGLFYAPFYVALARDAYAAEGVEVRFVSSPRPGDAARNVMDGTVDVCWGGPMRVMQAYQQIPGCDLVSFAEVVTRDPFLLLGREPHPGFALRDLLGVRVATVSEVPTPWMCLQEDLRRAGIAPSDLTRVADRTMAENAAALRRGEVDVVQVFEPFAAELLADGAGHLWYAQASRGPTSYTTFYARRGLPSARRDELHRMVRAIYRTQKWVAAADGAVIAAAIARYFNDVPVPILADACARYQSLGIWGGDPRLPRAGYDRLRASLVSGGFVSPGTPYEVAVDNSLADAVVAEDPPVLQ
ncbi:MAG TPA: ABC transporter substrate-binding protein [Acetobacteraceae bacterium]|nr:ABC transporter substrate-binding protein [Acetobacteraceae bacterium]